MSNKDLINSMVNTFGSPDFNTEVVLTALKEAIEKMKAENKHTGSLVAIINILPEIVKEAKRRY